MEHSDSILRCFDGYYAGKTVLVTGHTGFKGSWICEWLLGLGARVVGIALAPGEPSLFDELKLAQRMEHHVQDIRDYARTRDIILAVKPDVVFHMAAQPLVRESYQDPLGTYATNVMGTAHVLNALRELTTPCVAVCITTDKCYENREWLYGYRECDALGGYDPYSSSKACSELVIHAYKQSFFNVDHALTLVVVASVRAGNVIGGGDWTQSRLLPDCVRSLMAHESICVRNPESTRPWQHVLEPLSGYLSLGAALGRALEAENLEELQLLSGPFNFGPLTHEKHTVGQFVEAVLRLWPGEWSSVCDQKNPHEAGLLHLAIDKAATVLGWQPVWDFEKTVQASIHWYRAWAESAKQAPALTIHDLAEYTQDARKQGLPWAN
ncbi:MAG TPA: CDP-glucose 4,6-dehydratase [Opitutales bacterium]|nr:CDP-glucose 4,6-dehydratase [Opitutales bacterium]